MEQGHHDRCVHQGEQTHILLQDYLTAPMPYLIGVPAPQLLQGLEHMGLEEVVFVDLDAGTCRLGSQDGQDMDFALLPWAHHLRAAFQVDIPDLMGTPY